MQIFKYFLRYMNTKKALSRWTVFYVGLLINTALNKHLIVCKSITYIKKFL